ncbi:hypothetical protein FHR32_003773 [Streptosporangium album]|uniref:Uncharacterized protein n=1 Tax=Streptosporangium album TaxID=47479 RepID=A0A7W7RWB9_9ACTN|nr:hypothetical protein [Streptosporangium album]MBB4939468.1 hypothetical protein [Streptosporangium album]
MTASYGMDVSHADFRSTGTGLSETGASRLEEVRALRAYLEGEGDPWGDDDEMGGMVGAAYRAVTQHALDVYEALAERHVTTGGGVELMAADYRSAEWRSAEEADRIMRAAQRL